MDPSAPFVVSRRNGQEKRPWKELPSIENKVEAEFLHPILLGESILPYRVFNAFEGVVPVTAKGEVLDAEAAANRGISGLHGWLQKTEQTWKKNSETAADTSLIQQFDYYGKLSSQFPLSPLRVVYAKAGTLPAACVIRDKTLVLDHMLYWMTPENEAEASYLVALLNSETTRSRVERLQARGQFGARHFDKVMFNLPIPRFDKKIDLHVALSKASAKAEKIAAATPLPETVKFQRARKLVRDALAEAGVAQEIDRLVAELLDGPAPSVKSKRAKAK